VVAFAEVDDLDHHGAGDHDVVGLEVQMHDAKQLEVPQALDQHEQDEDLRGKGQGVLVEQHVLDQVGLLHVVRQQVLLQVVLVRRQVVLGQEHRIPSLYLLQDIPLVLHPAPSMLLLLPLHNHRLPD
jgi:hypothetical protein